MRFVNNPRHFPPMDCGQDSRMSSGDMVFQNFANSLRPRFPVKVAQNRAGI